MCQGIALEVNAAALPSGGQDADGGRLDAFVRVRDDQLHANQAAPDEVAEELGPEGLGLRRTDRHTQHRAPAVRQWARTSDAFTGSLLTPTARVCWTPCAVWG